MSGGGTTSTQTNAIPAWMEPGLKDAFQRAIALTDVNQNPYQQYGGERLAQFTDLQNSAFNNAAAMTPSSATDAGIGLTAQAADQAMRAGANFSPYQAQNQYQNIAAYNPSQFSVNQVRAPNLQQYQMQGPQNVSAASVSSPQLRDMSMQAATINQENVPALQQYQMGPAQQVSSQSFTQPGSAEAYMSPYMEQAIAPQLREAARASEIQRNANQAQAVKQGAYGGSRQAIVEAERQRNLATQQGDIRAQGYQNAFNNAQQQFNAEQQARLAAQQANQQAGLTVGQQNLMAQLQTQGLSANQALAIAQANQQAQQQANLQNLSAGLQTQGLQAQTGLQAQQANQQAALQAALANQTMGYNVGNTNLQALLAQQQLGSGQNLQAQLANQQYGLQGQQAQEAANQFGYNQAAQQAALQAQYGQAAQQLAEQSRQYGAGLGLQGLQAALQGASTLGTLGGQQFAQQKDITGLQAALGQQQQMQVQQGLDTQYQDFLNKQQYPYGQLSYLASLARGMPTSNTMTSYNPGASTGSQLLGAGTSLLGAYMMGGGKLFKKGGKVSGTSAGLADLALSKI